MKVLVMIGGLLGILISLTAILFAVVDDSYGFGNFGLLGVAGGVLGVMSSFKFKGSLKTATTFVIAGNALGLYGLWELYMLPSLLMLVPFAFLGASRLMSGRGKKQ